MSKKSNDHNKKQLSQTERIVEILLSNGNVPQESLDSIRRWLADNDADGEKAEVLARAIAGSLAYRGNPVRTLQLWPQLAARIGLSDIPARVAPKRPLYRKAWFQIVSSAAVVAIALGGAFGGWFNGGGQVTDTPVLVAVVEPAKATEVPHLIVETIEDVQKDVELADGTKVWINSGSKISYPENFPGNERHVTLTGEAYFEVAYNEAKPFVVHTEELNVRVLGTKFNIAEGEAATEVTLYTGSVEVSAGERSRVLVPNERLTHYHATDEITVAAIGHETVRAADWRSKKMVANLKTVPEILRMIENYYDVEIVTDISAFPANLYSIGFNKNEPVEDALRALSKVSNGFEFEKQGDTIIIYSKN